MPLFYYLLEERRCRLKELHKPFHWEMEKQLN